MIKFEIISSLPTGQLSLLHVACRAVMELEHFEFTEQFDNASRVLKLSKGTAWDHCVIVNNMTEDIFCDIYSLVQFMIDMDLKFTGRPICR